MSRRSSMTRFQTIPFAILVLLLCGPSRSAQAGMDPPASRACGVALHAPRLGVADVAFADTGAPSSLNVAFGDADAGVDLMDAVVPGVLSAEVVTATTSLDPGMATSATSLANVALLQGQPAEVTAAFIRAQSNVLDANGTRKWNGSAEIDGLVFGGRPITVTGLPNQKIVIPGVATLLVNEQIDSSQGGVSALTVNALHLTLASGDDVTLASARSVWDKQVTPPAALRGRGRLSSPPALFAHEQPECHDFVTGGGWFEPRFEGGPPDKVNFGFNAGYRTQDGALLGHVNVVDHNDGTHIKGVNVDTYARLGDPQSLCRMFEGDAEMNGATGLRYHVEVCDYGEPGRDDRFRIIVFGSDGSELYFADDSSSAKTCGPEEPRCGDLDGGNIQLHKNCDAAGTSSAGTTANTLPRT